MKAGSEVACFLDSNEGMSVSWDGQRQILLCVERDNKDQIRLNVLVTYVVRSDVFCDADDLYFCEWRGAEGLKI